MGAGSSLSNYDDMTNIHCELYLCPLNVFYINVKWIIGDK